MDIVLSAENGWKNTAVLMEKNGDIEYEWTIKEKEIPAGYTASYNQDTLTVINTYGGGSTITDPPATGDTSNIVLYGVIALFSLAGIVMLYVLKKKKEK